MHRVRLMVSYLARFDWDATVITVDERDYEEANDEASRALLPSHIQIARVRAWPAHLCRPFGIGDISVRAQRALRRKVAEFARQGKVDLVFTTVLPGFTSLVGAWAKRKFKLPFVLDYQDPWVSTLDVQQSFWSKAGIAYRLALALEPEVVSLADALTAVSDETLITLRKRKLIQENTIIRTIPIGAEGEDHQVALQFGRSHIIKEQGVFDLAYLGTLTERMLPALRTLLLAAKQVLVPKRRLRVHLIGTSAQTSGEDIIGVRSIANEIGVTGMVRLQPRRLPYLDALRTMQDADLLLLLGSTDSHYTASKIFPSWLARRPVLGVFHAASTVNQLARELGGVSLVTYDDKNGPLSRVGEVMKVLQSIVESNATVMPARIETGMDPYSGQSIAEAYANLFDRVIHEAKRNETSAP